MPIHDTIDATIGLANLALQEEREEIDDGIVGALAIVADSIGAIQAAVYRLSANETEAAPRRTHVWTASTSAPAAPDLVTSPTLATLARLRRGDVVQLEAPRSESRPSLAIPLRTDGNLLGFATFTAVAGQTWSRKTRAAIGPFGDILANAIGRQRAAAERRESDRRYRTLVDSIAEVIVHIDAQGQMSYVNRAWNELTGLTLDDMVGRGPLDSVHPDDRDAAALHMTNAMQGIDDEEREVRFLDATGGVRWMQVKGRALFDADGNVEGFTGVLHDVTVRREAEAKALAAAEAAELARAEAELARGEAELARAEAELARAEAERARDVAVRASVAKSAFLSRMSHELRTPLNAILGFGQLLQLGDLGPEDVENIDQILQAGRHLLDLINEVLDVVQVESGALSLSLAPVNVGQIITESLDLLRPAIATRGIHVKAPGRTSRLLALADRRRLKQILVNLLANAVKYNVQGGEIVVCCESLQPEDAPPGPGEWLRLSVQDTGAGIAPEHFADIFTPFQRLGAEKTEVEGAGLGLALTRTLVEAFGGRIEVQSEVGVGTTLLVDLPVAPPAIEDDRSPVEDDPIAPSYTVLYVEDNQSNVMLLRRVIARRPHLRLLIAQDGREGVETAQRIVPDLILLDLHLPGLDGVGVLTALRGSDHPSVSDIPIVVITADLTPEAEERVIAAGATVFLTKPIDIPHLLDVIDQHLPLL